MTTPLDRPATLRDVLRMQGLVVISLGIALVSAAIVGNGDLVASIVVIAVGIAVAVIGSAGGGKVRR